MADFALIGAAGFIAPRHMRAIKETGNRLVAAFDPCDSVGVLDQYFPDACFFTEFERFERHLEMLRRDGKPVSWLSVCSPNYLHDAHTRFGMSVGADVICEKPLVICPKNINALEEAQRRTSQRVYTMLQLRHAKSAIEFRRMMRGWMASRPNVGILGSVSYVTVRGRWYDVSWKGDESKSGGLCMNIGVHLFDFLQWIFGTPRGYEVEAYDQRAAVGTIVFDQANISWTLSVEESALPKEIRGSSRSHREIVVSQGRDNFGRLDFSQGFDGLHTEAYKSIIAGRGHGIREARPSIEMVNSIRYEAARRRR